MNDIVILAFNHSWPFKLLWRTYGSYKTAHEFRKQGLTVEVIDWIDHLEKHYSDKFYQLLDQQISEKTKAVCWSVTFSRDCPDHFKRIFQYIKQKWPAVKHIAGGSKFYNVKSYAGFCDLLISGFVERAIPDLINWILGRDSDLKFQTYCESLYVDCKKHYYDYHEFFPDLTTEYHQRDFIEANETLNIEFSRGCVFSCDFCSYPITGKKKGQFETDLNSVVEQIKRNHAKWGIHRYFVADDTFNDSQTKIKSIKTAIESLDFDVEFFAYLRPDLLPKHNNARDLYDLGCRNWYVGIESVNSYSTKSIGKSKFLGKLENYFADLKSDKPKDLNITASIIIGLPNDTIEKITQGYDYFVQNQYFDHVSYSRLIISNENNLADDDSLFSKNPKIYGYELCLDPAPKSAEGWYGTNEFLWQNQHMTWLQALQLEQSLRRRAFSDFTNVHCIASAGMMNTGVDSTRAYQIKSMPNDNELSTFFLNRLKRYLNFKTKEMI